MARVLIICCGCRGQKLGQELIKRGYVVRGTTRDQAKLGELSAIGIEGQLGDPDRVGTLMTALPGVAVACILFGGVNAGSEELAALHGTRLEMLLERMIDTGIRGIVYEGKASLERELRESALRTVERIAEGSKIPYSVVDESSETIQEWVDEVSDRVDRLLAIAR